MKLYELGTIRRLKQIALDAPWSVYDLLSSLIVLGIGGYLLFNPTIFSEVGGVYRSLASIAYEGIWGTIFFCCGFIGLVNTLWCIKPPFLVRLFARMAVAFCLLSFAFNNLLNEPPPLSTVTYFLLSIWSVWGILRTHSSGR